MLAFTGSDGVVGTVLTGATLLSLGAFSAGLALIVRRARRRRAGSTLALGTGFSSAIDATDSGNTAPGSTDATISAEEDRS